MPAIITAIILFLVTSAALPPALAQEVPLKRVEKFVLAYYNDKYPQAKARAVQLVHKPGPDKRLPLYAGTIYLENGSRRNVEATQIMTTGSYFIRTWKP